MKEINFSNSICRYCRFYNPTGRRGGSCEILGVSVESDWKACNFASPPFENTVKKLEDIFHLDTLVDRESNRKTSPKTSKVNMKDNFKTTIYHQLD